MPDLIADHVNSEGERVSIERVTDGPHAGSRVLVVWDDPRSRGGTGMPAPMKLDAGTVEWLREHLDDGDGS